MAKDDPKQPKPQGPEKEASGNKRVSDGENQKSRTEIPNPPARQDQRKQILDEKDKSQTAKAFAHLKNLTQAEANIVLAAIKTEKDAKGQTAILPADKIIEYINAEIGKTLTNEQAVRLLVQTSAVYAGDKGQLEKFKTAITNIYEQVADDKVEVDKIQDAIGQSAKQLGRSVVDKEIEESAAITVIHEVKQIEIKDEKPLDQIDLAGNFEKGKQNRQEEAGYEVFGRPDEMPEDIGQEVQKYTQNSEQLRILIKNFRTKHGSQKNNKPFLRQLILRIAMP